MTEELERKILNLIATDRIEIPISSLGGKLYRQKPKLGKSIDLSELEDNYDGERCYARIEDIDLQKSRTLRNAVNEFSEEYPKYGAILEEKIKEKRWVKELHLYFGMQEGARVPATDYIEVMKNLGFTEATAKRFYPELMNITRKISKKRKDAERRIIIG